jgi:ubiquinol-cytochrome c reductase iron-sulfur subunit
MSEAVTLGEENGAQPEPEPDALTPDPLRRRILTAATAGLAAVGAAATAIPFVRSWLPSESARALGSPVQIDISKLKPGTLMTTQWRKRPVWVLHRLPEQIARLPSLSGRLKDPLSRQPQQSPDLAHWNPIQRSIRPEYLLVVGICTHLGCIPKYRPDPDEATLGANWPGGFFCPCHGSRYDLAGRVMDGSPAPLNLPVPPHFYKSATTIVTGDLPDGTQGDWAPANW